jgi:hypothetical protein
VRSSYLVYTELETIIAHLCTLYMYNSTLSSPVYCTVLSNKHTGWVAQRNPYLNSDRLLSSLLDLNSDWLLDWSAVLVVILISGCGSCFTRHLLGCADCLIWTLIGCYVAWPVLTLAVQVPWPEIWLAAVAALPEFWLDVLYLGAADWLCWLLYLNPDWLRVLVVQRTQASDVHRVRNSICLSAQ